MIEGEGKVCKTPLKAKARPSQKVGPAPQTGKENSWKKVGKVKETEFITTAVPLRLFLFCLIKRRFLILLSFYFLSSSLYLYATMII